MSEGRRQDWLWHAARCGILVVAALVCPIRGYSKGRIILPTATLTTSFGTNGGQVGLSMASSTDGSVVVIGAPATTFNPGTGTVSGAGVAYVFVEPASGWGATLPQPTILEAFTPAADASFGTSVAISSDGSTIVVGAPGENGGAGAAFVFTEPVPNGWVPGSVAQNIELTAGDPQPNEQFGASVAISGDGNTIVVGAENHTVTANLTTYTHAGAAYVFTASLWVTTSTSFEITPPVTSISDNELFGSSVAVNGDASTIIVGGPGNNSSQGAVDVFEPTGSGTPPSWTEVTELTAGDGQSGDQFGISVAISGTTAVVGAPSANSSQGNAYVFTAPTGTWAQVAELTASGATNGSQLGTSVAISSDGSRILAGAPGAPPAGTGSYSQGTMYQFNEPAKGKTVLPWANETQSSTFEFSKSSQTTDDKFASSAAVSIAGRNTWIFAGAPETEVSGVTSAGAVYVFKGR